MENLKDMPPKPKWMEQCANVELAYHGGQWGWFVVTASPFKNDNNEKVKE